MVHLFKLVLVLLMPAVAAGLAVMSIDFGGEYIKIAIVKPGVPMEIVLNKESQRKTAAIVSIRDGDRLFGEAALNSALRYPKTAYRYLHEVVGKDFDNPLVTEFKKKHPYYDIERDPDTGSVLFVHDENTKYAPEELIAMIFQKAKEYAETFAEQPISEAVITVPAYFNQAERKAMLRAGELAGLKVLQLINDNSAVALNYGVFRRKSFNATPSYYMFFDIGAASTTATIVEYVIEKVKSPTSGLVDTFPQLTIKGVGFDRSLGGSEFQRRLRDHLAMIFNEHRKIKKNVFQDVKAMQKLYKEAGRVKQVLSANADHFAQVENLSDDEDFRARVTREEFEKLCVDLFERIEGTVKEAIHSAQITMPEISEVILMGGGTRVPRIQETLKKAIAREELGKGINTDEAAALGAVYQAAHLGKGFKVQKFNVREAVIYPIQVDFERVKSSGDSDESSKIVRRTLFGRMQTYPQKKVMTFNKHTKDFSFDVNYGDLSFLNEQALKELGKSSLATVTLTAVEEAFAKHSTDAVSKGIKAHFRLDESGILNVDRVEASFETTTEVPVEQEEESTLSKLGKSFSNFFRGQDKEEEAAKEGSVKDEEAGEKNADEKFEDKKAKKEEDNVNEEDKQSNYNETTTKKEEETKESKPDDSNKQEDDKKEESTEKLKDEKVKDGQPTDEKKKEEGKKDVKVEKKAKIVMIKEDLVVAIDDKGLKGPSEERVKLAKKHLNDLKKRDEEKMMLEKVKNEIESFVFDTRDKLEQKDYIKCSTEAEREKISEVLNAASDWMFEQEDNTPRKTYDEKLKELRGVTKNLFERVYELQERPAVIEALNSRINHTEYFLEGMKNFTGEDQPFTQVEYDTLKTLIKDTKEWNRTVTEDQRKNPLTEKPKFTIEDVIGKMTALDREIKYLLAKVKSFKPKAAKPKEKDGNETGDTSSKKASDETPVDDSEDATVRSKKGDQPTVDDPDNDDEKETVEEPEKRLENDEL